MTKPKITKEEQFRLKQQEMPDKELAELARNEVSQLCKTGGKSIKMCVPPMVTDSDMLLCEVIQRFEALANERLNVSNLLPSTGEMHTKRVDSYREQVKEGSRMNTSHHALGYYLGFEKCYEWLKNRQ